MNTEDFTCLLSSNAANKETEVLCLVLEVLFLTYFLDLARHDKADPNVLISCGFFSLVWNMSSGLRGHLVFQVLLQLLT